MSAQALERVTFSVSRAADFLKARALVSQTGQPEARFGDVVLKELLDNALDAAESARVVPDIEITLSTTGDIQVLTVADNGAGIPPGVVARVLDFTSVTSDKALYRSRAGARRATRSRPSSAFPAPSASPIPSSSRRRAPGTPSAWRSTPQAA
jgi:DNA topoisomerase VI subunit B